MKLIFAFGMAASALAIPFYVVTGQPAWALAMLGCTFINYSSFLRAK